MANRAYLNAIDIVPSPNTDPRSGRIVGISEWNSYVPIAFKLLMTDRPRKCSSTLWENAEETAIIAEHVGGVSRLLRELERFADPRIAELRAEASAFLQDPRNQRRYFLLECGEIYWLGSEPAEQQHDRLWREISRLAEAELVEWPTKRVNSQAGFLSRLFNTREPLGPAEIGIDSLGLGDWSEILYYDFPESDGGPATA